MSNKTGHRRGDKKRTEHGPRYENKETDRNSAKARTKWRRRGHRSERRTGTRTPKVFSMGKGKPKPRPEIDPYASATRAHAATLARELKEEELEDAKVQYMAALHSGHSVSIGHCEAKLRDLGLDPFSVIIERKDRS